MNKKSKKRILHIENNTVDRLAIKTLFDESNSLCCEVVHYGSTDEEMTNRLIKPFRVDTLAGAHEKYEDEYQRHRFSVAIIELVHSDPDREMVTKAQAGDRDALRQISTIPLIQAIEKYSERKTQIIVLTDGDYSPRMVRSLMDKEIGVDWVINATLFDLNIFSTLWKIVGKVLS